MQFGKTLSGVLLVITAATVGLALLYVPTWIVDTFRKVNELGRFWGGLYLAVVTLGACLFLGSLLWTTWTLWRQGVHKKSARQKRSKNPSELSLGQQAKEIEENLDHFRQLHSRVQNDVRVQAELDPLLREITEKRESLTLEIVAFGTISSGKSSILNLLAGKDVFLTDVKGGTTITRNEVEWDLIDKAVLVDTPGIGEIDGESHVAVAAEAAKNADLILLVVDGPLRQSEYQLLETLGRMEKRILVCLNKSDWYAEEDREKLLSQLRHQTKDWVKPDDVLAIQSQLGKRIRRRIKSDGTVIEEVVVIPQEIERLVERMMAVVKADRKELVMANLLLQSRSVLDKARQRVKQSLDERAKEIVERYMWSSAGLAAVNPFPLVDLAAGIGISTKMMIDLAENYGQKMDFQTASKWLSEMGKVLISVLGSQGASVAVGAVIASLIKAVPIAGTLVGNAMQGAIQALVTRWIGAVFIDYFGNEMTFSEGGLANSARKQWEVLTSVDSLRKIVVSAREKFSEGR